MKCQVCNDPDSIAEPHFGGISCRACAAFFRRYFHSKKAKIYCTCKHRTSSSHQCRSCRVEKCFEVGMVREKVQVPRDKNVLKPVKKEEILDLISSKALGTRIIPRSSPHICWTIENWEAFELKRSLMYGGKFTELNIFQATCQVKNDIAVTWQLVESVFPQTKVLRSCDKYALLANFVPKWWQLEPVIDHVTQAEKYAAMGEEELEDMIVDFYQGAFEKERKQERETILRTFRPFWTFYYRKLILPISERSFDIQEFLAILWLLFFDPAHTNISEEARETCENIRKVILRELRGYQIDNHHSELRVVEAIESLPIVERAVEKFEEELLICEMNGVVIHEDFQEVMRLQRR